MNARPTTSSSNLSRRALCPGSHFAEEPFGDYDDSSPESNEGDMLHGMTANPALPRHSLNLEQGETLDHAAGITADVFASIIAAEKLEGEPFEEGHEKELWLHRGLRLVLTGHCDRWRYYPAQKVLVILDYKFGRIAVDDAAGNYQLRAYAVQGAEAWDCARVYAAIVQPRVSWELPPIALYTRDDLSAARTEILGILAASELPDAPRNASPEGCKYCLAAAGGCPEYIATVTPAVPLIHTPAVQLTPEQMAVCLHAIEMLTDKWCDEVKDEARRRIERGELPGFKLEENAPRRHIVNPLRAFTLLQESGFTIGELFTSATLSVGDAEKLYVGKGRKKKEAKEALTLVLGDCIQARQVKPSISKCAA